MQVNWKKMMIGMAFILIGFVGFTTTGQAKTTWHKGIPQTIRGNWREDKKDLHRTDRRVGYFYQINSNVIKDGDVSGSMPQRYKEIKPAYHHKKGSKTYYVKSTETKFDILYYRRYTKISKNKLAIYWYAYQSQDYEHGAYTHSENQIVEHFHRKA
ncbi:hypothetical protein ACFQ44_11225 [Levilactobacillus lanxiensis]|uniref:Uncharacterized protein n=1 Tax=Levilactobacillus lanxiensis TaxID=2799568 RepID=A0ABW4D6L3_9LACO|nr:hypothetical protein [Levilactobacillus lanxiensis]